MDVLVDQRYRITMGIFRRWRGIAAAARLGFVGNISTSLTYRYRIGMSAGSQLRQHLIRAGINNGYRTGAPVGNIDSFLVGIKIDTQRSLTGSNGAQQLAGRGVHRKQD